MRSCPSVVVGIAIGSVVISNGWAAPRYWDVNGSSPGAGSNGIFSGTWDTTGGKNNWNDTADGTGAQVAWVDGSDAVFAAGTDATVNYSVTILGNPTLPSLTVEEGSVSITGALNFGATPGAPIDVASGASYTQGSSGSVIAGTGGITKTGAGTLVLRGTNTFTKSGTGSQPFLTIAGGVVDITADSNLGAVPSANDNTAALTIDGGTLRYGGSTSLTLAARRGVTIGTSGGTVEVTTASTLALPTLAPPTAAFAGTGTLTKTGGGRFQLNTSQTTFTGKYVVNAGSLSFPFDGVFGAVPAAAQADYFTLNGGALRVSVVTHATINSNRGITLGASGGTLVGPIEGMSFAGVIAGTQGGKLTIALKDSVTDTSTFGGINLNGANTYDGPTQIETGMTLRTSLITHGGVASGIGSSSSAAANLILNGGKLSYSASAAASTDRNFTITQAGGTIENIASQPLTFTSTDAIVMSGTGVRTFTLGGSGNVNNIMSPAIPDAGTAATSLTKTGAGIWVISNPNNSYTGNTTISGGRLRLGAAEVVPDASLVSTGTSSTVFDLNGFNETVRSISGTAGTIALGANTLSLASPSGETFSGVITGAGGSVVKSGSGMLTLGGANTYSGNTVIQGGTLRINNPYLANAADVLLTTGAILQLNFTATDVVDSLIVDGLPQAIGTWGAVGSGAAHESTLFTGSGLLQVTSSIPGDFNGDGQVDQGDYITWRKNDGTNNALPNDNGLGTPVSAAHFDLWRSHLGATTASGAGTFATVVPEASAFALLVVGVLLLASNRGRKVRN
jgi:fibronectin-binding autotransporter adhesin